MTHPWHGCMQGHPRDYASILSQSSSGPSLRVCSFTSSLPVLQLAFMTCQTCWPYPKDGCLTLLHTCTIMSGWMAGLLTLDPHYIGYKIAATLYADTTCCKY